MNPTSVKRTSTHPNVAIAQTLNGVLITKHQLPLHQFQTIKLIKTSKQDYSEASVPSPVVAGSLPVGVSPSAGGFSVVGALSPTVVDGALL